MAGSLSVAGHRQFTGDRAHWNVAGLISAKSYKLVEASALFPGLREGRLDLRAHAGWRDATQVQYHGLGIESPAAAPAAFRMQQGFGGADEIGAPACHLARFVTDGRTSQ